MEWSRLGHDNEVGADFVENWFDLFVPPDRDPDSWRRAVVPAIPPFQEPGWVMYDALLGNDGIVELRRVKYVPGPNRGAGHR